LKGAKPEDRLLALQLGALVQGLEAAAAESESSREDREDLVEV